LTSIKQIILAFIGGIFALVQWRSGNKLKRVEFFDKIISALRFDKENVSTMHIIDYNYEWYNKNFHNTKSKLEYSIDKLLSQLNYICYLKEMKIIKDKEFKVIRYMVNRTCISPCIQNYLWNLYHFSKKNNADTSFQYLIKYGIKNKIINKKNFYKKHSKKYARYLEF
jgi:hypothetical protein